MKRAPILALLGTFTLTLALAGCDGGGGDLKQGVPEDVSGKYVPPPSMPLMVPKGKTAPAGSELQKPVGAQPTTK